MKLSKIFTVLLLSILSLSACNNDTRNSEQDAGKNVQIVQEGINKLSEIKSYRFTMNVDIQGQEATSTSGMEAIPNNEEQANETEAPPNIMDMDTKKIAPNDEDSGIEAPQPKSINIKFDINGEMNVKDPDKAQIGLDINLDGTSAEEKMMAKAAARLIESNFYFNVENMNMGDGSELPQEIVDTYLNKWWKIEVPSGLMKNVTSQFAASESSLTAEQKEMRELFQQTRFFKNVTSVNSEKIKEIESDHYQVELDKEAFLEFVRKLSEQQSKSLKKQLNEEIEKNQKLYDEATRDKVKYEALSEEEKQNIEFSKLLVDEYKNELNSSEKNREESLKQLEKDLENLEFKGEVWIAKDSGVVSQMSANLKITPPQEPTQNIKFILTLWDHNQDFSVETPNGAANLPEETLQMLNFMMEMGLGGSENPLLPTNPTTDNLPASPSFT